MSDEREQLERLVAALRACELAGPSLAIVLGSGQSELAARLREARAVPFERIGGLPPVRVPGHAGRLVAGRLGGLQVLVQEGRSHLYEGHRPRELTRSLRAYARLGVRAVLLTNAAGGLRPEWAPGTLMAIRDHLNLQARTALACGEGGRASPYSPELLELLARAARRAGVALERGIYAGFPGPAYETPAEVRLARRLGADAVGMSTVLEASAAWAAGLSVGAVALITNPAAGLAPRPLAHADVLEAARHSARALGDLVEAAAAELVPLLAP